MTETPVRHFTRRLIATALLAAAPWAAAQLQGTPGTPISVLFVGNSYTFGRVDPVMSYNAANVRDLTAGMFATNPAGSNVYEPRPWGGVPGIFQQFTAQAGLHYDVAMTTRNAASLRGHLLNTNAAAWDLRSNIGSQAWDQMVLQEQSDEALLRRPGLGSNPEYTRLYTDLIEDWVHQGNALTYRERDFIGGNQANCVALGYSSGACSTQRNLPANTNASTATRMYLYETWARPNLVNGAFVTTTNELTGVVTRTDTPATTFFPTLEAMTDELVAAYAAAATGAAADGSGGFAGVSPVGRSFMRAVASGIATRDFWGPDAQTDGLIDLWFDDGTHASKYGSYLSALTLFGTLTGLDPLSLGPNERAAADLGITPAQAVLLQRVASEQLAAAIPEPATVWTLLGGLAGLAGWRRLRATGR
jgi:hypothetical protein